MRTTLNVDDDVLTAVQDRARREKRSAGAVISDLAREALTGGSNPPRTRPGKHGFRPLPHRGGTVSNALIDRLLDDEPE